MTSRPDDPLSGRLYLSTAYPDLEPIGSPMRYAKMLAQVVATVLVAVIPLLAAGGLGPIQWVNVALVALGALAVFAAPNVPGAPVTKMVLALLTAVAVTVHDIIQLSGGALMFGVADWLQIALAALGAVGVYAIPNQDDFELAA